MRWLFFTGLLFFLSFTAIAQTENFHGEIKNPQGLPLPFASVWITEIGKGTATNQTGFFQIGLKPGTYKFTIRQLGYLPLTQTVTISQDKSAGAFILKPIPRAASVPNANIIVDNVIAHRNSFRRSVLPYAGQLYSKNLQQLDGAPRMFFKKDVARKLNVSPDRRAIISLSESVSEYHTRSTDYIKERLISARMTNDSNAYGFNSAAELHIDLYKSTTILKGLSDHAFLSPIATYAPKFYRYSYAGGFYDNGNLVYAINVKPKHHNEHTYKGTIYVLDKSWLLYGADLSLNHYNRLDFADSISIKLQYAPVDSGNWVDQNMVFRYYGKLFGFKYSGYFLQLFQTISRDTLHDLGPSKEIFNSNRNNYRNNEQVLENERPLPLLPPEENFYTTSELNQRHKVDQTLTDSIQNTHGKFKIIDYIFNGYTLHGYKSNTIWTFPSPQYMWFYNTVEGFGINAYVRYKKVYSNTQHSLTIIPDVRYGFSDKLLNVNAFANYIYNPFHQGSFYGRVGTDFLDLNERGTINPFINSLSTLFLGNNYIKLYHSRFIMGGAQGEVANGVLLNGQFEYAERLPRYNTSLHTFNSDSVKLTSNNPLDPNGDNALFPAYRTLIFRGSATFTFDQQYKITPSGKFIIPNPYPRVRFNYKVGIHALGSDVNYSNISVDVFQDRVDMGLWGYTAYYLSSGFFLNTNKLYYPDYYQFLGGQSFFFNATIGTFHFLNYYTYSTDKPYFEAHLEHNFTGSLFSHVPLLNELHLQEIVGGSFLTQGTLPDYKEVYFGIKRTVFRLDYGLAFGRFTTKVQGFRFFYSF